MKPPRIIKSLFVTFLLMASGCNPSGQSDIKTDSVKKADLLQKVTVAGTVVPRRHTVFTPPYSGYIKKLYVKIGDIVKENDPIVSIVPSLNTRADEVFPIRAPFAGTAVQVLHFEGEYLELGKENTNIVRIDDLTRLFVEAEVPEIELTKLRIGQEVEIKASALLDRSYKGTIREIAMAAKEKKDWGRSNVEFAVRIEINDAGYGPGHAKGEQIKPGMSTLIDIIANKKTGVLTLRHEYIQSAAEQYFVILEDGTKRNIKVGIQNDEVFEITEGLKEGEKVRQTDFASMVKES